MSSANLVTVQHATAADPACRSGALPHRPSARYEPTASVCSIALPRSSPPCSPTGVLALTTTLVRQHTDSSAESSVSESPASAGYAQQRSQCKLHVEILAVCHRHVSRLCLVTLCDNL
ncbi:unnamed protein product [Pleuronectes platessa]|uniref:Uncharacterized protein n=1 Tax=Pleuronectes platessa TaxID=8262 RepID=A0A9N7TS58_PLEPL|nr:unnamed protein product [Pleuronectes platessa]